VAGGRTASPRVRARLATTAAGAGAASSSACVRLRPGVCATSQREEGATEKEGKKNRI
jgi:hypothetical protein